VSSCVAEDPPDAQLLENARTLAGDAGLGSPLLRKSIRGARSGRSGDRGHARLRARVWDERRAQTRVASARVRVLRELRV